MKRFALISFSLFSIASSQNFPLFGHDTVTQQDVDSFMESSYHKLSYSFLSPSMLSIRLTIPGKFPVANTDVNLKMDCTKLGDFTKSKELKTILGSLSDVKFSAGVFTVKNFSMGCEDGHVFAKSPQFEITLYAMEPFGAFSPNLGGDSAIDIKMYSGYKYPNIKEGYFYSVLRIYVNSDSVTANEYLDETLAPGTDITVGTKQGALISPVLFNSVDTSATYDSSQPVSIFYKASSLATRRGWFSVDIRRDLGKIAWRSISGPLK